MGIEAKTVSIRPATSEDIETVRALVEELENCVFDKSIFEDIYYKGLDNPDIEYYLVEKDSVVCAFFSLATLYQLHHAAKVLEIQELIVTASQRNSRVGAVIINFCKNKAIEKKAVNLELSSNMKRTHAHAFYLRNGFKKQHFRFVMSPISH